MSLIGFSPFRFVPTAQASLALAVVGLGLAWSLYFPSVGTWLRPLSAIAGTFLVGAVWLKYFFEPKRFITELSDPLYGSLMAPMTMTLFVLADYLAGYSTEIASLLWYPTLILHIGMGITFFTLQAVKFRFKNIYPSWFLYPVGAISGTLAGPALGHIDFAQSKALVCISIYFVMLPVVLYRLCFFGRLPFHARPTVAIMAAPVNLALAAYLVTYPNPDLILAGALGGVAITMTIFVYICYFYLLRLPFQPSIAAVTFPSVISAVAMARLNDTLSAEHPHWNWLHSLGSVEIAVSSLLVLWVCFGYLRYYEVFKKK